tara:strand:+ start:49 stop:489 length:441 start_codon:yes stop_codon:yes gene_type:complete
MKNEIPKEMLKEWCENYEEAIETLHYLANKSTGTAKEEIRECLEDFFIDNGLMSEEEFKREVNDEECSGNKMITDAWKKECNSDSDEVFEGETEALNKLYRNVGLPVKDSEPTDDQSLDKILEKDVEDTSMEEILKIADYLDKQAN